jgi:hypothetical protein
MGQYNPDRIFQPNATGLGGAANTMPHWKGGQCDNRIKSRSGAIGSTSDQLESIAGMTVLTMGLNQEHADKEKKNDLSRQE